MSPRWVRREKRVNRQKNGSKVGAKTNSRRGDASAADKTEVG